MDPLLLHATSLLSDTSATAVSALFSAIWQGTLLAACVALCMRLMPGLTAAARSAIWMNIFALLVLLHVLPAFSGHWVQAIPAQPSAFRFDPRWSIAIAAVWSALSLWRAVQLVLSAVRLHQLASRATPVNADPAILALIQGHETIQGHEKRRRRSAELCTSSEVERPSVFGFFRPRILLPPQLLGRLSPLELQLVVKHEMEHLHRADDWTNLLQKVGMVLFPLNPVLLWVERRLCAERELACDDHVLHSSAGRKAYAICLTRLAEYSMLHRSLPLVLGAWEKQSELVRRIHRILRQPATSISGKPAMLASAALVLGAVGCAVGLARSPQLVSFAPSTQLPQQARSLPSSGQFNLHDVAVAPHLVKAKMTFRPKMGQPRAVQVQFSVPSLRHRDLNRPTLTRAVFTETDDRPTASGQAWLVVTGFTDFEEAPVLVQTPVQPHLVITVQHETRPRYAAIQIENGWLIVQI